MAYNAINDDTTNIGGESSKPMPLRHSMGKYDIITYK